MTMNNGNHDAEMVRPFALMDATVNFFLSPPAAFIFMIPDMLGASSCPFLENMWSRISYSFGPRVAVNTSHESDG